MGRFVKPGEVRRIDLGPRETPHGETVQEWVEVRTRLTHEQRQALDMSIIRTDMNWQDGSMNARADLGLYQPSILRAYVTGWQLYDEDKQGCPIAIPFSLQALALLDNETGMVITQDIDAYEKARTTGKAATPIAIVSTEK